MNKKGTFTISLDCEGKWGVADNLYGINSQINQKTLSEAYAFIYDVLACYKITVTAAFTSLFTVNAEKISSYHEQMKDFRDQGHGWFAPIVNFIENECFDGWVGDEFFKRAENEGHEIAWHGSSHHPLGNFTNKDIIDFELKVASDVAILNKTDLKSVVFPRNEIGHLSSLEKNGFKFYRDSLYGENNSAMHKYIRVMDEFNVLKTSQKTNKKTEFEGLRCLPSGYFLNWPYGPRSLVPDYVTINRWRYILNHAAKHGTHAHLWFHPHNFITAPRMREVFQLILRDASILIEAGELVNKTMCEIDF